MTIKAEDPRFIRLLAAALARPPPDVPPIHTVRIVSLSSRPARKTVGLTIYSTTDTATGRSRPRQTITFYSALLDELSAPAAIGVIAHELAHAWLNEHVKPERSKAREIEADLTARSWGFGAELDFLDNEAETV